MARAGRGWQSGLRALTCAGLLLPAAGHAQTEVKKTAPVARPPTQVEVKKGRPGARCRRAGGRPAASGWSAEVNDRAVAAIAAEIGGDGARTRFSLVLSGSRALPVLPAGRPLPGDPRHSRRELPPAQGGGPAGTRPDPGLPLRPVRARQVAHRHRHQGAGARGGGRDRRGRVPVTRINLDLTPTDRASFLAKLPPPAPRPKETRGHEAEDHGRAAAPKAHAKPVIVIDAGHGGVDPGAASGDVIEKDVVLAVARHLRTILAAKGRYDVQMTRASDVFVSLDRRLAISRQKGASLFISIHADTVGAQNFAQSVRGATAYTLVGEGLEQAGPAAGRQGERRRHPGWRRVALRGGERSGQEHPDRSHAARDGQLLGRLPRQAAVAPEAQDCAVARSGPLGGFQGSEAAPVALAC